MVIHIVFPQVRIHRAVKMSINETPHSNADKRMTFTAVKKYLECSHTFERNGVTSNIWLGWTTYVIGFHTVNTGAALCAVR
jgi:hypothetical protein